MSLIEETTSSSMDLPDRGLAFDIQAERCRVRAMFAGHVVADSISVLILRRRGLPDLRFFPASDVETGYLGETREATHDPDLGEGRCFTCVMDGQIAERAACAFDSPPFRAEALTGRLCLSEEVFEIYNLTAEDLAAAPHATHPHGGAA